MKKIILFIQFICFSNFVPAQQNNKIDSLKHALISSKDDLNRLEILQSLSSAYQWSAPDTALLFAQQQLVLAKKINSLNGETRALASYGECLYVLGNYPQALDYRLQSLRLAEKQDDTALLIGIHFGLSSIYGDIGDHDHALYYSHKGSRISEKFHDKTWFVESLMIIGSVYEQANQLDSALAYTEKSYQLDSAYNSRRTLGYAPYVLGNIYYKKGYYMPALSYYRLAAGISKEQYIQKDLMDVYNGMSKTFIKTRHFDSAVFYSQQTLLLGKSTAYPFGMLNAYAALSGIYKSQDNTDSSDKYNELTALIRDSIFNKERVTQFQNLSFSEQLRKQEIEAVQLQYQNKMRIYTLLGGFGVLLVLAGILWKNNRQKQKAKIKIEQAYKELKATQAQLIQSEKMASLGELTAGIAHEIQNPLNFVNNFSEVNKELLAEMKDEMNKGNFDDAHAIANDVIDNQEKINLHGKRADAIVKGMLQHSQTSTGQKEPTNINVLADEYIRLCYHGLRAKDNSFNATIKTDFDDTIEKISIIPQDIGRVLLNVLTNAFYAVNEKKKQQGDNYEPTVSISTKKINARPDDPVGRDKIEIKVKDNGNGIPQKVLDKIFQPFFTTKPTGQGTGLGLSLSYDIIKAHGGELKVETKEDEYAEFIIELPYK